MCIHNLYLYHTFIETFKVLKYHCPISIYNLFSISPRYEKCLLLLPVVTLDKSMYNFTFKSASIWNQIIGNVLNKCKAEENDIVIPGSQINSDLSASTGYVKNKVKTYLLHEQKQGDKILWEFTGFAN